MAVEIEELEDKDAEEEQKRNSDYIDFRRRFDRIKQEHEADSANCDKLKNQGNNFFKLGLYSQSAMLYSEALELQPDNPVLYCNRSMSYLKQDMPHEALADAERSLQLDSSVENIKAYWRKSQSLFDLGRLVEAEVTADEGLFLQPSNQHLNRVRKKARESATMQRLCGGEWVAKMANGVEKRYVFEDDGRMKIYVFGHFVPATFDLSVEGNPRSMVVRMDGAAVGFGNGPPPPPRPYIFEFHDDFKELWLCTPMDSDELPTKFEGPGFDKLRRAEAPGADDEKEKEPLDVRCERYMRSMNEVMPLLPPQLPEQPSEQQIAQETLILEKISQLKRGFGVEVHSRALELARAPESAPTPELQEQATQLQLRFVNRKIIPPPPPPEPAKPAAPATIDAVPESAAASTIRQAPPMGCLSGISRLCCGGSS